MLINSKIEITSQNDKYIISHNGEKYFMINENTLSIIKSLTNNTRLEFAYLDYCDHEGNSLSFKQYKEIVEIILTKLNNETYDLINQYLLLRFRIISSKFAGRIGQIFVTLYKNRVFWILLSLGLILNIFNLFYVSYSLPDKGILSTSGTPIKLQLFYILLFLITPFLHEIGHISGCRNFKAAHGGIGLGFYFIFPVFYSDVSGIWMLSKKDRLKVNLGGIYFESIYTLILLIVSFLTSNHILHLIASIIFIIDLQQLNPFLRYDGYWIMSDLVNVPNLKKNSRNAANQLILSIFRKQLPLPNKKRIFLSLYSILNFLFLFIIFYVIFSSYTKEIVLFPITLLNIIKGIITGNIDLATLNIGVLIIASFIYFLLFQFIYKLIKSRYFKRDEISNAK